MSICLVSAFLDSGRDKWSSFNRSIDQYFNNFKPYLKMNHDMVVFMDDKHIEAFKLLCKDCNHITVIPINREWMQKHIYAYSLLPKETEIMASDYFKNLVKHRLHHPECCKPEYTMMTHSKIDFVVHVTNLVKYDYYAWTDFGFFSK